MRYAWLVLFSVLFFSTMPSYGESEKIYLSPRHEPMKNVTLRNWCIFEIRQPEPVLKEFPPTTAHAAPHCDEAALRTRLLLRPSGPARIVAILRKELDGRIRFNPPGFNYGPIPNLQELTVPQADELFADKWPNAEASEASNADSKSVIRTYPLKIWNSRYSGFLDLEFKENTCQKFRFRCAEFGTDEWYSAAEHS